MPRLCSYTLVPILLLASASLAPEAHAKDCPNGSVGKLTTRLAGHSCRKDATTEDLAKAKAILDLSEQAFRACKEGPAKDCEKDKCDEKKQPKQTCTVEPKTTPLELPPLEKDPECENGRGYYAVTQKQSDKTGDWYVDCQCHCSPR